MPREHMVRWLMHSRGDSGPGDLLTSEKSEQETADPLTAGSP
jgi:hypothetical protein